MEKYCQWRPCKRKAQVVLQIHLAVPRRARHGSTLVGVEEVSYCSTCAAREERPFTFVSRADGTKIDLQNMKEAAMTTARLCAVIRKEALNSLSREDFDTLKSRYHLSFDYIKGSGVMVRFVYKVEYSPWGGDTSRTVRTIEVGYSVPLALYWYDQLGVKPPVKSKATS